MPRFHERLFADDYAAGGQLGWVPDREMPLRASQQDERVTWRLRYLGSLRFDSLLSRQLVLPDSHLLDGRFFLSVAAGDLRAEIGRPLYGDAPGSLRLPIVIRARRSTLRQTIAEFLMTDKPELNGFSFKCLPNEDAAKLLARALKTRTWPELDRMLGAAPDPARGVGNFLIDTLRRADVAPDQAQAWIEPLVLGWLSWLALEDDGETLTVESYPWGGFPLREALELDQARAGELSTPIGRAALRTTADLILGDKKLRTNANDALDELRAQAAGDDMAIEDLRVVDQIYSRVRYRAIAHQHDAIFVRTRTETRATGEAERLLERVEEQYEPSVGRRIELPDALTSALGEMSHEDWRGYLKAQRDTLVNYWDTGDLDLLRAAVDKLADVLVPPQTLSKERLALLVAGSTVAGGVLASSAFFFSSAAGLPEVTTTGVVGAAGALAPFAVAASPNEPQRAMRRRIAEVLNGLGTPVVTDIAEA